MVVPEAVCHLQYSNESCIPRGGLCQMGLGKRMSGCIRTSTLAPFGKVGTENNSRVVFGHGERQRWRFRYVGNKGVVVKAAGTKA